MRDNIFDAVVSSGSAALLKPQLPRRQIQIIMDHQQIVDAILIIIQQLHHSLPAQIHKSLWLYQQNFLSVPCSRLRECLTLLLFHCDMQLIGYSVNYHKTYIMFCLRIFLSRIAQTDYHFH